MNQQVKTFLIIIVSIIVAGASLAYGAMTAPQQQPQQSATPAPKKVVKLSLKDQYKKEESTITGVLTTAYPKIATDYTILNGQLFKEGEWYGALLVYKGSDTENRDTLRVLMQKKDGVWTMRTTPPEMLLSAKKYPDVPMDILKSINKPVSLP